MKRSPQMLKERHRKSHYSRLAFCRLAVGRWRAIGNERWAEWYERENRFLTRIGPRELGKSSPLVDCFIFYPNPEGGWDKTHFKCNNWEDQSMTEGMQSMVDFLLLKQERKAA